MTEPRPSRRPRTPHPADRANANIIANAVRFDVALFIGRGKYAHAAARTLDEARNVAAPALEAEHPYGRKALIYAIDANGRSALVTGDIPTGGGERSMKTYTKKFNAERAARAERAAAPALAGMAAAKGAASADLVRLPDGMSDRAARPHRSRPS
jgi:hypothetical protein